MVDNSESEHDLIVERLWKPGEEVLKTLTPHKVDLDHAAKGVAGEGAEILEHIKKHVVYQQELDIPKLKKELGDLEFFLKKMRWLLGLTRDECLQGNTEKLSARYPKLEYSDKAAIERVDTD